MDKIKSFFASKAAKYVLGAVAVAVALYFAIKFWPLVVIVALLYLAYVERANLALAWAWLKEQFESHSDSASV